MEGLAPNCWIEANHLTEEEGSLKSESFGARHPLKHSDHSHSKSMGPNSLIPCKRILGTSQSVKFLFVSTTLYVLRSDQEGKPSKYIYQSDKIQD